MTRGSSQTIYRVLKYLSKKDGRIRFDVAPSVIPTLNVAVVAAIYDELTKEPVTQGA